MYTCSSNHISPLPQTYFVGLVTGQSAYEHYPIQMQIKTQDMMPLKTVTKARWLLGENTERAMYCSMSL